MPNENESFFDPVDLAMFAGPRNSVPLMSLLYSKEVNAGADYERFAQQRAYQLAMAERKRDEQMRRAIALREQQELDARIPPEVQRFYINSRYDPATATRRADYETPPARNFGLPGTEMRAAPRRFQKGGSARKTLQQMMDELLVRGTKTTVKAGRGAELSGVLGGGKTNIHPDISKAAKSWLSSGLSAEQLAKSLGVSIEEAPNVLPQRESAKNLRKFVNPSTVRQRVFHGSNNPEGIVNDAQFAHYEPDASEIHWFSPNPDFADQYTYKYMESPGEQGAIFPAYIQLQNPVEIPFDMNAKLTPDVWKFAKDLGFSKSDFQEWLLENDKDKPKRAWNIIDTPQFREAAASRGYDGIKAPEGGVDTYGVFDPRKIKSQFNEGTYDITTPDIGKKEGGAVHSYLKVYGR